MKQRHAFSAVLAVLFLGSPISGALAAEQSTADLHAPENTNTATLDEIHHINQKEIELAKIALQKSSASDVRGFAQKMVKEHGDADKKVISVAQSESIVLQPFTLSDSEKTKENELQSLSGTDFDRAYIDAMKDGHEAALAKLKSDSASTDDPHIKALIHSLLPTVQHHEDLAMNVQKEQENGKD
jgi:predicted outer membrane protein